MKSRYGNRYDVSCLNLPSRLFLGEVTRRFQPNSIITTPLRILSTTKVTKSIGVLKRMVLHAWRCPFAIPGIQRTCQNPNVVKVPTDGWKPSKKSLLLLYQAKFFECGQGIQTVIWKPRALEARAFFKTLKQRRADVPPPTWAALSPPFISIKNEMFRDSPSWLSGQLSLPCVGGGTVAQA